MQLGRIEEALNKFQAAEHIYRSILKSDERLVPNLLNRGNALVKQGRYSEAWQRLAEAESLCSNTTEPLVRLSILLSQRDLLIQAPLEEPLPVERWSMAVQRIEKVHDLATELGRESATESILMHTEQVKAICHALAHTTDTYLNSADLTQAAPLAKKRPV
jgi:tetratricopeptide (TPR) repeat protein